MMTVYDDERVVTLLRDVDLPAAPADRLGEVSRRARAADSRRLSALAGAMSLVLLGGILGAVSLHGRSNEQVLTVADSARTTQAAGTARMSLRIAVTRSAQALVPVGDLMTLSGPVDFRHDRYQLTGAFQKSRIEVRVIGKDQWMRFDMASQFPGFIAGTAPTKAWLHTESTRKANGSPLDNIDPAKLLDALTTQGTTVRQESLGDGRTSTVVRISEQVLGASFGPTTGKDIEVTAESDAEGRIRRLTYDAEAPGLGATRATLTYDDFGIEVEVSPPPADQVQEAESIGLTSEPFSTTTGSSPADRKRACDAIRAMITSQPAPTDEQQKAAYEQFKKIERQVCAGS